jgi:hypothetical protein
MASRTINGIVESLVSGRLDLDSFMQAVQKDIEDSEAESQRY